jgi:GNAT superfamily N-acetyltransferase
MIIRKAKFDDAKFIYENLAVLRGDVEYSFDQFISYYKMYLLNDNNWIFIAKVLNEDIGFVTVNIYSSIRFIGNTLELEEVVIIQRMRGKGFGGIFLKKIIEKIQSDKLIRKIVIKTDDLEVAGKLYLKEFALTNIKVFQKYLNKI